MSEKLSSGKKNPRQIYKQAYHDFVTARVILLYTLMNFNGTNFVYIL